jgi:hypothetical protein
MVAACCCPFIYIHLVVPCLTALPVLKPLCFQLICHVSWLTLITRWSPNLSSQSSITAAIPTLASMAARLTMAALFEFEYNRCCTKANPMKYTKLPISADGFIPNTCTHTHGFIPNTCTHRSEQSQPSVLSATIVSNLNFIHACPCRSLPLAPLPKCSAWGTHHPLIYILRKVQPIITWLPSTAKCCPKC